jgi:subtilisin family serine protease
MNTRRMRGVALVGALVVVALVVGLVWFPGPTGTGTSSETSQSVEPAETSESVIPGSDSVLPVPSTEFPVPDSASDQPTPDQPRTNQDPVFVAPQVDAEIAAEGSTTVIVRLDTTLSGDDAERSESARAAADELLDTLPEGSWSQVGETGTVPVVTFTVNAAGLEVLRRSELVDSVAANERKIPTSVTSSTFVGARSAWGSGWTGAGSTIAVLDTGVQTNHPYLMNGAVPKTVAEACFSTASGSYVSACPSGANQQIGAGAAVPCGVPSTCKHGTHVAGIAVGGDAGATNPQGVAPGASLIAVQVFAVGCSSKCIGASDSDINAALQWLYSNRASYPGLAAVNLSLGGEAKYTAYCNYEAQRPFIQQLLAVGIATVVAAGNDGWRDGVTAPGCIQEAVTVGAQDDAGAPIGTAVSVASFSNIGPQVDFLAPGSGIKSSVPGSGYDYMNGTSMATPAVAGAFAIVRQASMCDPAAQLRNDTDFTSVGSFSIPGLRLDKAVRGTPCQPRSVTAVRGAGTVQVSWVAPSHPGSSAVTGYDVKATPGGATCTTSGALTCTLADPAPGYVHTYTVRARNAVGLGAAGSGFDGGTQFTPMTPQRVLDTRSYGITADGLYEAGGAIGPQATRTTPISGRVGIPADAVAVVLNVTATDPTAWSNLLVFPAGTTRPLASNLNFTAGQTVPNLVVVKLGTGGAMSLFNAAGSTQVAVDVMGYYRDSSGSKFTSLSPQRVLDTRPGGITIDGQEGGGGAVGPQIDRTVPIAGRAGVPVDAVAVVVNVTVANPTAWSNLLVYPTGDARPLASNLNYSAGQTVPNLVIVKLGANGDLNFFNAVGSTQVIADVMGYYRDGSGTMFTPLMPARLLDSRPGGSTVDGSFSGTGRIGAGGTLNVMIAGRDGVPSDATAVVLNLTAVDPSAWSNLLAYPTGTVRPLASNLNYTAGRTVPNLVIVKIGSGGRISLYNALGTVDVVADVMGYYR